MQCLISSPRAFKIHQLPCACSNVVVVVNAADLMRPRVNYNSCVSDPSQIHVSRLFYTLESEIVIVLSNTAGFEYGPGSCSCVVRTDVGSPTVRDMANRASDERRAGVLTLTPRIRPLRRAHRQGVF